MIHACHQPTNNIEVGQQKKKTYTVRRTLVLKNQLINLLTLILDIFFVLIKEYEKILFLC